MKAWIVRVMLMACFCLLVRPASAQECDTVGLSPWEAATAVPDKELSDSAARALEPLIDRVLPGGFLMPAPGGPDYWNSGFLHSGLNAQFGMSVTAAWGRHAPRGAGFGQHLGLMYVAPLTSRFAVAAGLTADHLTWGGDRFTSLNLMGAATFRLTDRVSVFAYGAKRLLPRKPVFGLAAPFFYDRSPDYVYGGGFDFQLNEHSWLQISFEKRSDPVPVWRQHPAPRR